MAERGGAANESESIYIYSAGELEWRFRSCYNLSELYLTIGDTANALEYANQSVELADRSSDAFHRIVRVVSPTTLANALHQAGNLAEAEHLFQEAEG